MVLDKYLFLGLLIVLAIVILIIITSFSKQLNKTIEKFTLPTVPTTTTPLSAAVDSNTLDLNMSRYYINDNHQKLDSLVNRLNKIKLNLAKLKKEHDPDTPLDITFY